MIISFPPTFFIFLANYFLEVVVNGGLGFSGLKDCVSELKSAMSSLTLKPSVLHRQSLIAFSITFSKISISSVSFPRNLTKLRRLSLGIRALDNSSSESSSNDSNIGGSTNGESNKSPNGSTVCM